jgi:PAS domain S-box-containing protein
VHQIELEMQNDELRRAQAELEKSRSRYFDLYDLAPVGFCSLDEAGVIEDSNLAFEAMLDLTRGEANRRKLSQYIHRDDQDVYYLHHKRLVETGETQTFELP